MKAVRSLPINRAGWLSAFQYCGMVGLVLAGLIFACGSPVLASEQSALDVQFRPVVEPRGTARAMLAQPDGRIVLAGSFTSLNGIRRTGIGRLNGDGSSDLQFAPQLGPGESVRLLAPGLNDSIWIAGDFS